jgi:AcrR family transcriptional regulator
MMMPRVRGADSAERVLDAATSLFYELGIHAVGLQRVIDECGCGKSLLYREFPSKDDLVMAYLDRMHVRWIIELNSKLERHVGDPRMQILDVVRAVGADVGNANYRGCAFLNASAEFPYPDHAVQRACSAHVASIQKVVRRLTNEADLPDPGRTTDHLMFIINGLRASGPIFGKKAVKSAIDLAHDLVDGS